MPEPTSQVKDRYIKEPIHHSADRKYVAAVMLSKESLWCLDLYFRSGERFFTIPLVWNSKTREVSISKKLFYWRIIAIILFSYFLFAFLRLINSFFILGLPLQDCIIQVYFVISSFYFGTAHLAYWFNYEELATFWTRFLQFDAAYSGPSFNGEKKDKIGLVLKLLTALGYSHMSFQGAAFIAIRKNPNFVYSLIWEIWGIDDVWLMALFAVFEVFIVYYSWMGTLSVSAGILLFPGAVHRWADHVNLHPTEAWKHQKGHFYRCLQILVSSHQSAHSLIALPRQELAVLFGGVICTYATIRLYGKLHLFIYLTMPNSVAIMIFYEKYFHDTSASIAVSTEVLLQNYEMAMLNDAQEDYYRKMSSRPDFTVHQQTSATTLTPSGVTAGDQVTGSTAIGNIKKLQRSMWLSFHPLRVSIHNFYDIDRGTVMTFGSLVLGNAINLLLT